MKKQVTKEMLLSQTVSPLCRHPKELKEVLNLIQDNGSQTGSEILSDAIYYGFLCGYIVGKQDDRARRKGETK